MDRRTFVAAGAGALAATASGAAAAVLKVGALAKGETATITGWLQPASRGPGHYFVLGPDAGVVDPAVSRPEHWPNGLTMVLPADASAMAPGRVTLSGKLYRGRFRDEATGHAAAAVLVGARPV